MKRININNMLKELKKYVLIIVALFTMQSTVWAQGLPEIQMYSSNKYGGGLQIWDIDIDKFGVAYFANNYGLATYDGVNWNKFQNANKSHIRCMAFDSIGNLFAGGSSTFGYFYPNAEGVMEYNSLTSRFVDTSFQFTDIWTLGVNSSGVLFSVVGGLLFYDYDSVHVVKSGNPYVSVFSPYDHLCVHISGEGFFQYSKGKLDTLPSLDIFTNDNYLKVCEYSNGRVLVTSESSKLWVYDYQEALNGKRDNVLHRIPIDFENRLKAEMLSSIDYDSVNNAISIATLKGLYVIDTVGVLKYRLDAENGLFDHSVISVKYDKLGNTWVGGGSGISYVNSGSSVTVLDQRMGLNESPYDFLITDNYSYFTTTFGLYSVPTAQFFSSSNEKLHQITESNSGGWCLMKGDDEDFVSISNALYRLDGNQLKNKIVRFHVNSIDYFNKALNELAIGSYDNAFVINVETNSKNDTIPEVYGEIDNITYLSDNHVVVETSYSGVASVVKKDGEYTVEWFNEKKGYTPEIGGSLAFIDSTIYLCSEKGIYNVQFDKRRKIDSIFIAPLFSDIPDFKDEVYNVIYDSIRVGYWIHALNGLYFCKVKNNIITEIVHKPYKMIKEIYGLVLHQNHLIFHTSNEIHFYNLCKKDMHGKEFNTIIKRVVANDDLKFDGYSFITDSNRCQYMNLEEPIQFKNNKVHIGFAAPYFFCQDSMKYECKLVGFDAKWVSLGIKTTKEYTNLSPGSYEFIVRGINIFDDKSQCATLFFEIDTPWYRTTLFIIIYLILGIVLLLLIIKFYTYRLKRANIRLEGIVRERTSELQIRTQNVNAQNEKIRLQNVKILDQSKHLEDANKQLSQLSVVAQNTDNGVIIVMFPRIIQYLNDGMSHLLDLDNRSQIDDQLMESVLYRFQGLVDNLSEIFENPESKVFESILTSFQQRKKWLQITLSPVVETNKNVDRVVVVCTDITAIKLAEEEISQQREELLAQSELLESINSDLERANQMMTDSINYAQRIQNSMLPNLNEFKKIVNDTFVFYKPKDIVSGDFYWYKKINDVHVLITADCTGHGVPGAFMSMIGHTLLKEITDNERTLNPAEILSKLNDGIQTILRQREKFDEIQDDGMDMTACVYDSKANQIQISLANHRAFLIRGDEKEQIEGEIFSVGGNFSGRTISPFTNKEFTVNQGDILYMFTDGFHDQLGGDAYTKFGSDRFIELLYENYKLSFVDQVEILNNEYSQWKDRRKQTDDILVWGIRF
ncbi:MAG: SpoIIE family protein phosphatase [Salinivirgaceae bacterium]|nr:SpoIIE family protein phosphatase [Salinivirgaceae bacterium]